MKEANTAPTARFRVYVAGPMTGLPEYNFPAFHAKAAELRAKGWHVENPAENTEPPCKSWGGYMRNALRQMLTCDAIYLLPGWSESRGASIEKRLAQDLGLAIIYGPGAVAEAAGKKRTFEYTPAQGQPLHGGFQSHCLTTRGAGFIELTACATWPWDTLITGEGNGEWVQINMNATEMEALACILLTAASERREKGAQP